MMNNNKKKKDSSVYPMAVGLVQLRVLVDIFNCWISGTSTNNR